MKRVIIANQREMPPGRPVEAAQGDGHRPARRTIRQIAAQFETVAPPGSAMPARSEEYPPQPVIDALDVVISSDPLPRALRDRVGSRMRGE